MKEFIKKVVVKTSPWIILLAILGAGVYFGYQAVADYLVKELVYTPVLK